MTDSNLIEASNLTFRYGDRVALDSFSLTVPSGTVFGLLGPNGSGKSTFVTMLAAMEAALDGSLHVFGQTPSAALRRRVGTVFQENTADPQMTVSENLDLAGRLFGLSTSAARTRGAELLARFGLSDRRTQPVESLSGGMRRRLEMCRALLHDPELLLLDEPTTGVDPEERQALWETLLKRDGSNRTILLATNDLAEADAVCDRVAFIQAGKVVASGAPAELKQGLRRESVRITWPHAEDAQLTEVASWVGVGRVSRSDAVVHVTVDDASTFVPRLFALAPGAIRAVNIDTASLDDAYFAHVARRPENTRGDQS